VAQKLGIDGTTKHTTVTKPKAANMALLYPQRVMNEDNKKDTNAMLKSL
jgi:hypothetical protein